MPTPLPYVVVPKNIEPLFKRIASAKVPEAFTHNFLYQTIGLKGRNDRALIPLLRALGFIDTSGKPTPNYNALKNESLRPQVIAEAVRRAYAPLFEANETANELPQDQLRGLIAQVAGTDQDLTGRIVSTFNALIRLGDFSATTQEGEKLKTPAESPSIASIPPTVPLTTSSTLRPEFHYNLQIHLPSNATEETYLNIFNALRKVFQ